MKLDVIQKAPCFRGQKEKNPGSQDMASSLKKLEGLTILDLMVAGPSHCRGNAADTELFILNARDLIQSADQMQANPSPIHYGEWHHPKSVVTGDPIS